MFRTLLLSLLTLSLTNVAQADTGKPDMYVNLDPGHKWDMSPTLRTTFSAFLQMHIQDVRNRVKDLYWPTITDQTNISTVFREAFYPGSAKYKNREVQCAFVRKILDSTQGKAHERLSKITHGGSICIQNDLPINEWNVYTQSLIEYIWSEKWIASQGQPKSLEDLIAKAVGPSYKRPEIYIATHLEFDGYGGGFSIFDRGVFKSAPELRKFESIIQTFDPNITEPFTALGPDLGKVLSEARYDIVGYVQPGSKIYISNAWAPADLVELLTHEYGHVFHGETDDNYRWDASQKTLTLTANSVHHESVAESFAWMVLRDLYDTYPEIKFFHVAKLQLFSVKQRQDNHLVGAAAVHSRFHSAHEATFTELKDYARALDFGQYLDTHGFASALVDQGEKKRESFPVFFESLNQ